MEHLAFKDTQSLHQSIQQLYTLHNLDTFGVDVLSIVNRLVPGNLPTFYICHFRTRQILPTFLPDFSGFSPEMNKTIDLHFGEHPIAARMPLTLNGAYKISDFITQDEFHRLEGVYQQFFRKLNGEDLLNIFLPHSHPDNWRKLAQTDASLMGICVDRSRRNFTERDRLLLNLLRPHIFQAHCNAQQHDRLKQELSQLQQSLNHLGLAIIDTQGRIQSISPQAIIWLEIYFGKSTNSRQLPDHLWAWVKHQTTGFTNNLNLPNGCLPLRIQQTGRELKIRLIVEPLRAQYLLLLEEQTLSSLNLLELLGLSQRETEVLAWVIQGKDNKKIAAQLSIHPSTVRKHLENIYRKLGVQSRTEAISQVLAKLGFLDSLQLKTDGSIVDYAE
jgi:DNA-binding CsgD family transcriptional regulator